MQRQGLVRLPPDCRPPGSDPPAHASDWRAARASSYSGRCRRAGDAADRLLTLGHVTHHVLVAPLTPLHQGAVSARPPGAPCRHPRSPAAPGRHRGPARPGTRSTPSRFRCVSTKPRNRLSPVIVMPSATTIVASSERLAVQHEGHNVLPRGPAPGVRGVSSRGLNERAGHRRPRQADRPGNRLGGRRELRHEIPYSTCASTTGH